MYSMQDVADRMIQTSDSNPLVLANLAWSIVVDRRSPLEEQEWRSTLSDLSNLIEREDDAPFGFDDKYPMSVSSSMMMAFDSLPRGAQTLLCLISALSESPFVPEIVLELLFSRLAQTALIKKGDSFLYCTKKLEARALIVRQDQIAGWTLKKEQNLRTWTIHDLRQWVIRSRMQNTIDEIFQVLFAHCSTGTSSTPVGEDNDSLLSAAVIFIFGDQKLSEDARLKLGIEMARNTLMKTALEPFIWLLQPNHEENKIVKLDNKTRTSGRYSTSASTSQHVSTQEVAVPFDQHECARRVLYDINLH